MPETKSSVVSQEHRKTANTVESMFIVKRNLIRAQLNIVRAISLFQMTIFISAHYAEKAGITEANTAGHLPRLLPSILLPHCAMGIIRVYTF